MARKASIPPSNPETTIAFDVDDTLIMHSGPKKSRTLKIEDPHLAGVFLNVRPHKRHIDFLKRSRMQGFTVYVWSGGGKAWADKVVDALNIREYVNHTMSKFVKFVDDLDSNEILVNRIYLNEKGNIQK